MPFDQRIDTFSFVTSIQLNMAQKNKTEKNTDTCHSIDESQKYAKLKKVVRKRIHPV
jgi:hypothetical protein